MSFAQMLQQGFRPSRQEDLSAPRSARASSSSWAARSTASTRTRIDLILADPAQLPREAVFGFAGRTLRTRIGSVTDGAATTAGCIVLGDDVTGRNASADSAYSDAQGATERIGAIGGRLLDVAAETSGRAESAAAATEEMRAAVGSISQSSVHVSWQVRDTMSATADGVQRMEELQLLPETSASVSSETGVLHRIILQA